MDWWSAWEGPIVYIERIEIDPVDAGVDAGRLTAWLIIAVIALAVSAAWYRHRSMRRSFWCAILGRDVEIRLRSGRVLSCSAFEDPTAIACARRCLDRGFRVQWPPVISDLTRPRGTAPFA